MLLTHDNYEYLAMIEHLLGLIPNTHNQSCEQSIPKVFGFVLWGVRMEGSWLVGGSQVMHHKFFRRCKTLLRQVG
jgi:hypothetical protein